MLSFSEFDALVYNRSVNGLDKYRKNANEANVGDVVFVGGVYTLVTRRHVYPPNYFSPDERWIPVRKDWIVVQLDTTNGHRWFGVDPNTKEKYESHFGLSLDYGCWEHPNSRGITPPENGEYKPIFVPRHN